MLEERREELRREIARRERELETLEAMPDLDAVPNGSVLSLVIKYAGGRPYVVIAYKVRDWWYLTGAKSPNGVASEYLAEWLTTGARSLVSATVLAEVTVEIVDLAGALEDALIETLAGGQ